MKAFLFAVLLLSTQVIHAQDSLALAPSPTLFDTLLMENGMSFSPPDGMVEIAPIENMQMNYEKAFKDMEANFEVRYAIRRHDFNFPESMFEMTVLNISGGQLPEYTRFGSQPVKTEFGADVGYTVLTEVGAEFGQRYKYCLLVYIYKKDVGDGYIFYLTDDADLISTRMGPIFHALRFND